MKLPFLAVCSCCIHLKNTLTTTRQDHSSLFDLLSMLTALGVYSVQCMNMKLSSRVNFKNRRMALLSILLRNVFILIKHCARDFWKTTRHWDMSPRISALWLVRWEVCIQRNVKFGHIPPRLTKERLNSSDPRWRRVCLECLDATRYVKKQVRKKKTWMNPPR